ncbi:hypothetical protein EON64_20150, partial [archaeon]
MLTQRFPSLLSPSDRPLFSSFEALLPPSPSSPTPSLQSLGKAVELLGQLDIDKYFQKVPTSSEAPGYRAQIKHPMALGMIRGKLDKDREGYGVEGVDGDVKLLVANAITYNGSLSAIGKQAMRLLVRWVLIKRALMSR